MNKDNIVIDSKEVDDFKQEFDKLNNESRNKDNVKFVPEPSAEIKTYISKGYCNMCGMCCKAIKVNCSFEVLKEINTDDDAKFILKHWEPMTEEESFKVNPHLKN